MLSPDALWIPMLSLWVYIPLVCYLDLKYREIEHWYWLPLVLVNFPIVIALIQEGNGILYIPGLVATAMWFVAMRFGVFEGADFLFLTWISLFFIYNPLSNHWLMSLSFTIFLVACLIISGGLVLMYNLTHGNGLSLRFDKLPMMIPISAALILTVMLA